MILLGRGQVSSINAYRISGIRTFYIESKQAMQTTNIVVLDAIPRNPKCHERASAYHEICPVNRASLITPFCTVLFN